MTGSANVVICLTAGVTPLVNAVVTPSSTVTAYYGQKAVAVAGTAVQLSATSYILQNGLIVTSLSSNTSTGLTIGNSGVTNALTGSGNGTVLYPGGSISIGAGVNLNSIYINSTALDIITYAGS
jgi:hypothetical protein